MVCDLILDGARQPADFTPYSVERLQRMRRVRLMGDVLGATEAEDADNRQARRTGPTQVVGSRAPRTTTRNLDRRHAKSAGYGTIRRGKICPINRARTASAPPAFRVSCSVSGLARTGAQPGNAGPSIWPIHP
jgi:hypothetical protein